MKAIEGWEITDVKTASALVRTGPCWFGGIWCSHDGVADQVFRVHDGLSATGKVLIPENAGDTGVKVLAGSLTYSIVPPGPVLATVGLYVTLTSGGGNCGYQALYLPIQQ